MTMPGISMDLQKEIQYLKPLLKHKRKVARQLGIDRETVAKYWWPKNEALAQQNLTGHWPQKIDWQYVRRESESGISIKTLYKEFSVIHELPLYENFIRYYRLNIQGEKLPEISLRVERHPGKTIEVDYSGDKMEIINPTTGEILKAELFVAAMSFSSFFYGEFTFTQKLGDFLNACKNAFEFIGGVPQFIVSDNCLTAVTKAEKHDFFLNKSFSDFCRHYGIIADPARVMRPKDKPNVENAIGVIQKEFFQRYRNETFTSLVGLNQFFRGYLIQKLEELIPMRKQSRRELLAMELPLLRSLPATPFEFFNYKKCKVHPDCHIRHDTNCYSVPYVYVGKEVELKFNSRMVYVYFESIEIAIHQVAAGHGRYTTIDAHYPEDKLLDTNFHIQSSIFKSKQIGPFTAALVEKLFAIPRNHPLRNLTKVYGILGLRPAHSIEAVEYACEAALESNKLNYSYVKSCAKNYRIPKNKTTLLPSRQLEFVCLQGGLL